MWKVAQWLTSQGLGVQLITGGVCTLEVRKGEDVLFVADVGQHDAPYSGTAGASYVLCPARNSVRRGRRKPERRVWIFFHRPTWPTSTAFRCAPCKRRASSA